MHVYYLTVFVDYESKARWMLWVQVSHEAQLSWYQGCGPVWRFTGGAGDPPSSSVTWLWLDSVPRGCLHAAAHNTAAASSGWGREVGAQVGRHRLLPPSLCSDASVQCLHSLDHCKAIKHADSSWPETVFPMASCKAFVILYQQVEHRDRETRQQNGSLWVVKLDVFVFSLLLTDIFLVKSKWGGQLRGGIRYVVLFLNKSRANNSSGTWPWFWSGSHTEPLLFGKMTFIYYSQQKIKRTLKTLDGCFYSLELKNDCVDWHGHRGLGWIYPLCLVLCVRAHPWLLGVLLYSWMKMLDHSILMQTFFGFLVLLIVICLWGKWVVLLQTFHLKDPH